VAQLQEDPRLKRALIAIALAGALCALQMANAAATNPSPSPSPCPTPSSASGTRLTCPSPTPDPTQATYDALTARLGGDLAKALTAQQSLNQALDQTAASEQTLSDQISQEEDLISNLQDEISQLDSQISDTQDRIDVEKEQLATVARAIYRQPSSLWQLIARTGSLRDALVATADLVLAGQRAHALQAKLESDLAKLKSDRQARQNDLDRENATLDTLNTNLTAMDDLMNRQADLSGQLDDLMSQFQSALDALPDQPPDVTSALAQLLESQEADLVQRSYQAAWSQAQVGAGLALIKGVLPLGTTLKGLVLSWPMTGFRITQPFGPTSILLEPALGQYAHFHTGVDLAAPLGTDVTAAADGVVVAVGHTGVGYGNYVIIAHGGGIESLYGHLLETEVLVGDHVIRGQRIGREGSTGFSTGPHLHFELRLKDQVVDPMPYLPVLATNWAG
jgi:murein DD-endopeptidase MepM/ murein hydrolase activator NlpD